MALSPLRRPFESEVIGPSIPPWMKEPGEFARIRIDSRQVRTLVQIASVACERQVVGFVGSPHAEEVHVHS